MQLTEVRGCNGAPARLCAFGLCYTVVYRYRTDMAVDSGTFYEYKNILCFYKLEGAELGKAKD